MKEVRIVGQSLEAGISKEASRLVDDFANANFSCGEWDTDDERPYEALHSRAAKRHRALSAAKRHRALTRYIALLEADKRRLNWMQENYIAADFEFGPQSDQSVLVIRIPRTARASGNLRTDIDAAITASDQENHTLRDTPQ